MGYQNERTWYKAYVEDIVRANSLLVRTINLTSIPDAHCNVKSLQDFNKG